MEVLKDRVFSALLELLRAGLWEREVEDLSLFPLDEKQWRELYKISHAQTVTGIVYRGISYLPEEFMPPAMHSLKWVAQVDAIERRSEQMNEALANLCKVYREAGLNPVLQKGQGVAQMYAVPSLRESGDIDLWFSTDEWQAAAEVAKQISGSFTIMPDGAGIYKWQGFDVEHHTRLMDFHNPFKQGYVDELVRSCGYDEMTLCADEDLKNSVPSPLLNLLMLNTHILKHAVGWGVGLRQLCDMTRACYCLSDKVYKTAMEQTCRKLGLGEWNRLLHAFLIEYLGLPKGRLPYEDVADDAQPLLEIVYQSGNFGCQYDERTAAENSAWRRKMQTATTFCKRLPFVFRYAPKETFWIFVDLLKGQAR